MDSGIQSTPRLPPLRMLRRDKMAGQASCPYKYFWFFRIPYTLYHCKFAVSHKVAFDFFGSYNLTFYEFIKNKTFFFSLENIDKYQI